MDRPFEVCTTWSIEAVHTLMDQPSYLRCAQHLDGQAIEVHTVAYTTDQSVVLSTVRGMVLWTLLTCLVRDVLTRAKQSILPVVEEVLVLTASAQRFCDATRKRHGVVYDFKDHSRDV
ncbi:hypothetical protein PCANC_05254 [Puccinia coronata f. sp. avenae]|uniref:Uncharacterized protein n=1 Tax=Puccinia coronata f. sp. avenae TaxID=200324 RepID=A0A2N5VYV7_9BASI|nr:hypothetical protein PCANC_05254 [Puccinia coronata f. sp. avenae]